jgi:hypothetical protein
MHTSTAVAADDGMRRGVRLRERGFYPEVTKSECAGRFYFVGIG